MSLRHYAGCRRWAGSHLAPEHTVAFSAFHCDFYFLALISF